MTIKERLLRDIFEKPREPKFNFCSAVDFTPGEPCPDYLEDGGDHLCGENIHQSHTHRCSCTYTWGYHGRI